MIILLFLLLFVSVPVLIFVVSFRFFMKRDKDQRSVEHFCLTCETLQSGISARRPLAAYLLGAFSFLWSRKLRCKVCNSAEVVPANSPKAQRILKPMLTLVALLLTAGAAHAQGRYDRSPQLVYAPDPQYSEEAVRAKISGMCVVSLTVDEQGNPQRVQVVRPLGHGLDEKALEAVKQYRFKPATLQGKPVPVEVNIEVNFRINSIPTGQQSREQAANAEAAAKIEAAAEAKAAQDAKAAYDASPAGQAAAKAKRDAQVAAFAQAQREAKALWPNDTLTSRSDPRGQLPGTWLISHSYPGTRVAVNPQTFLKTAGEFRTNVVISLPKGDIVQADQAAEITIDADCSSRTYQIWGTGITDPNGFFQVASSPENVTHRVIQDTPMDWVFGVFCR